MKNIFKAFIILILTFILCIPMQTIVKASTYTNMGSKKDVLVSKPWTVSFNKPLSAATVNSTNIKVVSESNKYMDIKVTLSNNNKNVIVESIKNYEANVKYTLIVTEKVKCEDGKPLPKEVRMEFNTKGAPTKPSDFTVCIDPAQYYTENTGKSGIKAKDINLSIALKLGSVLKARGFKVVYTRDNDSVSWNKTNEDDAKATIARNAKADVLLSVNTNAFPSNTAVKGIETYYLSNLSNDKMLATLIQNELIKATGAINRGIKEGSLEILKRTSSPVAVLQLGFLSNLEDEVLLASAEYQNNAAKAIANGLMNYAGFNNTDTSYDSVLKISSVQDIAVSLEEGSKYIFPKTLQATMSNNSKQEVQVQWLQDFVSLSNPGTYTYEGDIKDYDKKVKAVIQVTKTQTEKFIVCINAARGGSDNGAMGPTGLKEKDVNLDVALRLGKLLEKENVQVIYTRSGDSVTWNSSNEIQERINIANNAKSDLLVTISCNSVASETANGIETYYLNGSAKGKQLAEYIQAQLISKTGAVDRKIIGSELNSLKLSNAPGVMATLGFISNKTEEGKLKTTEYKDKLASAFAEAIIKYISVNPKSGNSNGGTASGNVNINDITENIRKGDTYTLPLRIKIATDNGEEKEVDVVWDIKSLDTTKVGSYSIQGTIKESTKKANLVVNVIEITKTNYKVVLDAGHGGHDPGAVGVTGIQEKTVALAITLKVGNILAKNGVETIYTRTSDNITWSTNQTQNMQARCDISNKAKPNYFVSIHANSFTSPAANGIETWYLSGNTAGAKLAQAVQTELIKETGRVNRGIKPTSGFYVVKNVNATAILVETGFLSNPEEEKLLGTEDFQNKLAKAIATGILKNLGISTIVY